MSVFRGLTPRNFLRICKIWSAWDFPFTAEGTVAWWTVPSIRGFDDGGEEENQRRSTWAPKFGDAFWKGPRRIRRCFREIWVKVKYCNLAKVDILWEITFAIYIYTVYINRLYIYLLFFISQKWWFPKSFCFVYCPLKFQLPKDDFCLRFRCERLRQDETWIERMYTYLMVFFH